MCPGFSRFLALFLSLILPFHPVLALPHTSPAQAGWATVDITPPLGIALGGRGPMITLAKQVLDPLQAQVLFLNDANGNGLVVISFDLAGLPHDLSDRLRQSAVQELGVDWNLAVLNCSHTHSGPQTCRSLFAGAAPHPPVELAYFETLTERIVQACRNASTSLQPVTVQVFEGASRVAINRRNKTADGRIGMQPNADGPIDEKLWVLKLTPVKSKRPPAILFSYACHPVIVYGYNYAGISADFPGVTRNVLQEALGAGAHVQFVQGVAGNVRPRVLADPEKKRFRTAKAEDCLQAGSELARDVLTALDKQGETLSLRLSAASDRPLLRRDSPPSMDTYEKLAADKNPELQSVGNYWLARYESGEGFSKGEPWPVGLIRLSDSHWIVHMAGEPVVEWREKIAGWLAPRKVVAWGYSQESLTYLPTDELLPEGGYEVLESNRARASSPAPFAPGINETIRSSLQRQLRFIEASP